ncbi:Pre-mRNA splicing factor [Favolaschia claudopus]|uniref:Pre-mRNA splicing factor n=1 Tax=Favolaschia claudopus TaxID=2862362 RepID=A0AAW0CSN9_9AGAR
MSTDPEPNQRFIDAQKLVKKVFDDLCAEYRLWKSDYVAKALQQATRPKPAQNLAVFPEISESLSIGTNGTPAPPSPTLASIEVWDSDTETTTEVPMQIFRVVKPFAALAEQEFCTPTARNIFLGDDPHNMPFLPFPEDPSFNHNRYAEEYKGFSWEQQPSLDHPDLETVVVEAARRLHNEHGMLYQHIDETGILPLELLDRDGMRGMIYLSRRRDFPDWPPGLPASQKMLQHDVPEPTSNPPDKSLGLLVSMFCTNLNCNVGFCSTHLDPTSMPLTEPPQIRGQRFKELLQTPCGEDCFLVKTFDHDQTTLQWVDNDTQLLRTVLDFSPDTEPCDLAVICDKPCFEVFAQRRLCIPDESIKKVKPKTKPKPKPIRSKSSLFDDLDTRRFTPGKPCRHDGPCDSTTNCICYINKAHCESGCRCSRKCIRRWAGCACTISKVSRRNNSDICRTKRCACFLAHRECDPEICGKCQAKDAEVTICQNTDIQRGRWKRTKVAPARYGMGLFMEEAAGVDDLIIEYVGELIYEPTAESREPIAEHRGRNYLFELNNTLAIDGTYAANNARFINHDAQKANAECKVRMVNGEHRIGIYATRPLRPGEEILFNYGNQFFPVPAKGTEAAS